MHDTSDINRQIQETKLASLGRLTASIAHEIRNPLGAISHAAQLLKESDSLIAADKRLADIIHVQSNRLNEVVQNVLRLSRKDTITPEVIKLAPWLTAFVKEFSEVNKIGSDIIRINIQPLPLHISIDGNHFHQILWNLCSNAMKYGGRSDGASSIVLHAYVDRELDTAYLDVVDQGPGVESNEIDKLFEPFYTTSTSGTGLGLYISRDLCISNGGDLTYVNSQHGGGCFRIRFANYQDN